MNSIQSSDLKHNPEVIKGSLKKVGTTIVATEDIKVYFPERYISKELAFMGSIIRLLGYFVIVNSKDQYGTMVTPAFFELTPYNTGEIEIDGDVNIMLEFNKGDIFISNTSIVKSQDFYYDSFDEFFVKGKMPWFFTYNNVSDIFLESTKYSGTTIGRNPLAYELLAAVVTRSSEDKRVQYRHVIKDNKNKEPNVIVGLSNIYYSFDNTASKLFGSYYGQGVTAAIVNKETKTTAVADILRD